MIGLYQAPAASQSFAPAGAKKISNPFLAETAFSPKIPRTERVCPPPQGARAERSLFSVQNPAKRF
jgi:hypothetical protein